MTVEEHIASEGAFLALAKHNQKMNYLKEFEENMSNTVNYYTSLVNNLKCLNEIAKLYIEHRAFGEYPTTKEEYADETMKILDKYKIEIGGE